MPVIVRYTTKQARKLENILVWATEKLQLRMPTGGAVIRIFTLNEGDEILDVKDLKDG